MRDTQSQGADDLRARLEEAERDGAKLQGLNQQLAARVAELEKSQEAGKAPACHHHHRITPECPECDKGKAPACECPTRKALTRWLEVYPGWAKVSGLIADDVRAALSAPCPCAERAAAFVRLSEQLLARYVETFPTYAWTDDAAAIDLMAAEITTLRAELAAEKERADANYASCERVKQKFEETWNESKRLRARVETLESALRGLRDEVSGGLGDDGNEELKPGIHYEPVLAARTLR